MKRASVIFQEFNVGDEAKLKHQTLSREYLELQKDFVSKKRKLRTAMQKRDNLVAIVKFLRQKRRYLLNCQPMATELESNLVDSQNVDRERSILAEDSKHTTKETSVGCEGKEERKGLEKHEVREVTRAQKIPRKYVIDDKRLGKKKISWRDQLTVKA